MLNIDLRSILILAGIMGMLMTGVVFLLRRSFPPSIKGLSGWASGTSLVFIAAILIAARGKLPDLLTTSLANLLLLGGIVMMLGSLRRLLSRPPGMRTWVLFILAVSPVTIWFAHIDPQYDIFRLITAFQPAIVLMAIVHLLWRHGGRTMPAWLMLGALVIHLGVTASYMAYHSVAKSTVDSLFAPVLVQTLYLLSYALTFLVLNIGFVLMVSDRLRFQLEHSIAEHQLAESELQRHRDNLQQMVIEQTVDLIQAKEVAEAASKSKSEFLASMSHELRTPLNAVLGYAQLLELDEALTPEAKGQVKEVELAGRHLLDLVNDLIDLARIDAGKINLSPGPVDLQALLHDCMSMVRPAADQHGIALIPVAEVPEQVTIYADSARLSQVMINLLTNAIKYNRAQGTVRLSLDAHDDVLRLSVSDSGQGIPPEMQKRLFTAFDRLGKERGAVEGTGIGLIISRRLVEAMGGSMGFHSEPGLGSTFWAEFPILNA